MLLAAYTNVASYVMDIIIALALIAAITFFFIKKKSMRLLIIYTVLTVVFVSLVVLDEYFHLPIARAIIEIVAIFMIVALAVVYQADLKVFFFNLTNVKEKNMDVEGVSDEEMRHAVDEIILACQTMSKTRTGALIVIAPTTVTNHILETGVELNAKVSNALIEAIFNTKAPFHDGAAIVKNNTILAAGCFLPLSQTQEVSKNLGTRHRAGIGITEETDMLTIIVSEETGIISVAKHGELRRFVTPDRLRDILHDTLKIAKPTVYRTIKE